ncbi:MAG UNVERIFIED_CONTAM: hypothetical protein LVR18_40095 [Planctomycetaceae bacterium]
MIRLGRATAGRCRAVPSSKRDHSLPSGPEPALTVQIDVEGPFYGYRARGAVLPVLRGDGLTEPRQ